MYGYSYIAIAICSVQYSRASDVGRVKSREVKIYAPAGFKATWQKFLEICDRDGDSASQLVRKWVEGYVARKEPGNPQRPLTAFVEGHEDQVAMRRSSILKELMGFAIHREGEVSHRDVVDLYRGLGIPGFQLVNLVESMEADLKKLGVVVVY